MGNERKGWLQVELPQLRRTETRVDDDNSMGHAPQDNQALLQIVDATTTSVFGKVPLLYEAPIEWLDFSIFRKGRFF